MGLETFLEGSAWAEFEGFSNNLFLRAIEGMDMGDEAYASWPTSRACSTRKPTSTRRACVGVGVPVRTRWPVCRILMCDSGSLSCSVSRPRVIHFYGEDPLWEGVGPDGAARGVTRRALASLSRSSLRL